MDVAAAEAAVLPAAVAARSAAVLVALVTPADAPFLLQSLLSLQQLWRSLLLLALIGGGSGGGSGGGDGRFGCSVPDGSRPDRRRARACCSSRAKSSCCWGVIHARGFPFLSG